MIGSAEVAHDSFIPCLIFHYVICKKAKSEDENISSYMKHMTKKVSQKNQSVKTVFSGIYLRLLDKI